MSNIKNVRRAPIYVELDGKKMPLRYTLNSFAKMEEKYGSVDAAMKKMEAGNISLIRFMLYVGLSNSKNDLTEEQVGDMIEMQDIEGLANKLMEAMGGDLPKKTTNKKVSKSPNK